MMSNSKLPNFVAAVAFAMSLASTAANSQTTANGPYYAKPSWDQKLQCDSLSTCPRFVVLTNWNGEAVLDRETGLTWQRTLDAISWSRGNACNLVSIGGRWGWRLPTLTELLSIFDPVNATRPYLPEGHPFFPSGLPFNFYLLTSTQAGTFNGEDQFLALYPGTRGDGTIRLAITGNGRSFNGQAWCVRGSE